MSVPSSKIPSVSSKSCFFKLPRLDFLLSDDDDGDALGVTEPRAERICKSQRKKRVTTAKRRYSSKKKALLQHKKYVCDNSTATPAQISNLSW